MSDAIDRFIGELEAHLSDLPKDEIEEAVSYYREYLNDAVESGEDPENALNRLGTAEKIAAVIRVETSIDRARSNPGVRNYGAVLKNSFRVITTPFSILFLSMFVMLSGGIFITFYAGAFCTFLGSVLSLAAVIYEAANMSGKFIIEIIGILGAGIMFSAVLMLATICLYKLGRLFIRLSVWTIGKILNKPQQKGAPLKRTADEKSKPIRTAVRLFSVLSFAGFVVFAVSGLPMRYFNIFNSMKPQDVELMSYEFDIDQLNEISVETAHSIVIVSEGSGDKVRFIYEKPDWLDCAFAAEGNTVRFREKSNGRLPFFELVSLHESLTELKVYIPKDAGVKRMTVKSKGGHVFVSDLPLSIRVETMNGSIQVNLPDTDSVNVAAETSKGVIYSNNTPAGQKTGGKTVYAINAGSDKTVELQSANGDIRINK
ncbi:MAG: DUF1700 domain-containing protein [Clostridiaceae bacterium]|nr:DUF1700 domain-containing protein [Clostridiaceae bacterium]